jgi:nicotinamide mononucleotide (NMN) deamidase PncC
VSTEQLITGLITGLIGILGVAVGGFVTYFTQKQQQQWENQRYWLREQRTACERFLDAANRWRSVASDAAWAVAVTGEVSSTSRLDEARAAWEVPSGKQSLFYPRQADTR